MAHRRGYTGPQRVALLVGMVLCIVLGTLILGFATAHADGPGWVSFRGDGNRPLRWNSCKTPVITYSLDTRAAVVRDGRTAAQDAAWAFGRLALATGFHFQQIAANAHPMVTVQWTNYPVDAQHPAGQIAWTQDVSEHHGHAAYDLITSSSVEIRPSADVNRPTVLLHELGHVAGLGHVSESNEIMYPYISTWEVAAYRTGDLAGLKALGARSSCPVPLRHGLHDVHWKGRHRG